MRSTFTRALVLSAAAHLLAYGGAQSWMAWRRHRTFDAMDIDLSRSSLMPLPPSMVSLSAYKPPEDWFEGDFKRLAPRPALQALSVTAKVEETASAACPPPCPGQLGDWAPASQAVQKPQWTDGMITEDDYPKEARDKNITGLVVVQVLLDASGAVRAVTLLQGSDQLLNDKTLEKLRQARFSPCIDAAGRPFPCQLRLPIHWTLE